MKDKAYIREAVSKKPAAPVNNSTMGKYHPVKNQNKNKNPPLSRASTRETENLIVSTDTSTIEIRRYYSRGKL